MNKLTINDLVRVANKAGYRTYLKSIRTVRIYGANEDTMIYVLGGKSWESPFEVAEKDIEDEYNVFVKIIENKQNK